ncbi:hypothetical protein F4814DRAFT_240174 [Daldinia grandis]|nr:hypothetical protein F4814DRAFT_240174 [Daldinia grandis]
MEANHSYYYAHACSTARIHYLHTYTTYIQLSSCTSLSILLLTDGHAWPASVRTAPHHDCLLWAITMIYGLIPSALSFSPFLFIDIQLFSLITP